MLSNRVIKPSTTQWTRFYVYTHCVYTRITFHPCNSRTRVLVCTSAKLTHIKWVHIFPGRIIVVQFIKTKKRSNHTTRIYVHDILLALICTICFNILHYTYPVYMTCIILSRRMVYTPYLSLVVLPVIIIPKQNNKKETYVE